MTITAFFSSARPSIVRRLHDGPLGPYVDEYASQLLERGVSRMSARRTLRLIAHLSRWLERQDLGIDALDEFALDRYQRSRARTWPLGFGDPIALRRFLGTMRERDICATPSPTPSPRAKVQDDYIRYLSEDIGLSARTVEHYTGILAPFLGEQIGRDGPNWPALTGAQILRFFRRCARQRSPHYLQRLRCALRSFLRYLQYRGAIGIDLSNCIPRARRWRLTGLPQHLSPRQVRSMLGSCNRRTAVGKRDYAILLILAHLGLRAIEVCTLSLDAIDWQTGQLLLHAKGGERALMPLPHEVGRAILDYLQNGRPRSQSRRVFLRHNAPHTGFSRSSCISCVAKRAMLRVGLDRPSKGAHVLRHTLATQMLRHGASLREIGQVLRHRRPDTTRIYAKVDLPTLRSVAMTWPEGAR
jgi:site-specific recombinase XerD